MQIGITGLSSGFGNQSMPVRQSQGSRELQGMPTPTQEKPEISTAGRMLSEMPQMDSETRTEMIEFGNAIKTAINSGTFDAAVLAEQAPEALKNIAEEQGFDLTAMLEQVEEKAAEQSSGEFQTSMEEMGGMQGPRPGHGPGHGGGKPEPSEEMDSYLDEILAAIDEEDTDIATLAENAPEEVQAMASEAGITVEEMVEEMASGILENGDPREKGNRPPPPAANQQGIDAYTAQLGDTENQQFMTAMFSSLQDS